MALIEESGGTQTATVTTEHTLATLTNVKTYVLVVDTSAMVAGDELELRVYTKTRSGNASQLAWIFSYAHAQEELNKYSLPVPANIEAKFTLKQTAGTSRNFIWAVLSTDN